MKKLKSYVLLVLAALFLTACVTDQERPTNVKYIEKTDRTWQQHFTQLKQIQGYQALGQLGYISSKERFSTRFDWQYNNPRDYTLKLYSTISSETLQIQMHAQGMTISDNKGRQRSAADAKMLLREIIGMDFPLEQFAFWLKGQPEDNADYQVGENHLLATFSRTIDGKPWTADYLSYHVNRRPPMPENILLKTEGQTLKIRVDEWLLQ
ncbi:lipoprotein localization factor LolB [Aggregatibacter actinomycetemcomitans]|uniref:Outer-membrane lipoprotein LolB n=2 Tax=Aggregatibacter actinomycetemcomitans TaxID=714 RepID=A0A142FYA3_AGGAC|nr:lipoprotein insertase outer membrane protein LolB [Aggregatibacter actinomycetemcomitans]AFI86330.1 membrane protein [Aggregatibacter actinomycetemcomitans D7S-1]KYK95965.1 membrane protein [Aggregatibacter actinomycetemcomitans serotype d str. SA3733]AMQ93383.1 outer membrane lipoprotein LolB [Aggregatibacter actinomycetemcomitans]ANU82666.1 lipoprotein localization factor LolB [Aggregatibacter actinomycetemcomitans]EKX95024.1 outer membrane lipoprotein LolB [Aggregatibacter actinomycetemc